MWFNISQGGNIMKKNIETLKTYRDIIMDIKLLYEIYNYNIRLKAIEYLDNQTNEKFNLYCSDSQENKKEKVKVLTLGSNHLL